MYEEADRILGWSLSEICFQGPEEELTKTSVCQPALFVHGYVVYKALEARGETHDGSCMSGLSLGELTALTAAGAFDFQSGLRVVAERGRLMQEACETSDGTMASIIGGQPEEVAELAREHDVDIANLNCPGQIVLSGDRERVMAAVDAAKNTKRFKMAMPLKVAGAYHSRLMKPARDAFAKYLESVEIGAPQVTVFSNVTGQAVRTAHEIRQALTDQVVSSVRWEDCIRACVADGAESFVECGVGGVLAGLIRRIDRNLTVRSVEEHGHLSA